MYMSFESLVAGPMLPFSVLACGFCTLQSLQTIAMPAPVSTTVFVNVTERQVGRPGLSSGSFMQKI